MKYRGYTISQNTRPKNCYCKRSGHRWTEDILLKTYTIYGLGVLSCINNKYRSIKRAKEYIDFIIRNGLNRSY